MKFNLKHYSCVRRKLLRGPIRRKVRRSYIRHRRSTSTPLQDRDTVNTDRVPTPSAAAQLNLFGLLDITELYVPNDTFGKNGSRRSKRKSKKSHAKKGLQYKIELRIRKHDRSQPYRRRDATDRNLRNEETIYWSNEGIVKLHIALLHASLSHAKRCDDLDLTTITEVWIWITKTEATDPFSFIRCCELAGVDPDIIRQQVKRLLGADSASATSDLLLQVDLLRSSILAAEAGDRDAAEWCNSDAPGPMTFVDSCRCIGFDPTEARKELRIPIEIASFRAA